MHGCADPVVVYGWQEKRSNKVISDEWLEAHGIEVFAEDQVNGYAGMVALYGISCSFNKTKGKAKISAEEKDIVQKAYESFAKSRAKKGEPEAEQLLEYHLALEGDMCWDEHTTYNPSKKREER